MNSWIIVAMLLVSGVSMHFRGVRQLAAFSRTAKTQFLVYFNNENEFALLDRGKLIPPGLETRLWSPGRCCAHRTTPSLSHDGRRIAFVRLASVEPRTEAVSILDVASGTQTDVFSAHAVWGISFAPGDQQLAVVADGETEKGHNLFIIELATASIRQLTHGLLALNNSDYLISDYAAPSWGAAGKELAVELRRAGPGAGNAPAGAIVVWDLKANSFRKLAEGVEPSWSPAGDAIAFYDQARRNCYSVAPDGSGRKLLFSSPKGFLRIGGAAPLVFPVVWSPDGRRLIFHEWVDADLITDVYRFDLHSAKRQRLGRTEVQVVNWR